jgi:hypothetical protein
MKSIENAPRAQAGMFSLGAFNVSFAIASKSGPHLYPPPTMKSRFTMENPARGFLFGARIRIGRDGQWRAGVGLAREADTPESVAGLLNHVPGTAG